MKSQLAALLLIFLLSAACSGDHGAKAPASIPSDYWDYSQRGDQETGGIRMIPIQSQFDDPEAYFGALIQFVKDVDAGRLTQAKK